MKLLPDSCKDIEQSGAEAQSGRFHSHSGPRSAYTVQVQLRCFRVHGPFSNECFGMAVEANPCSLPCNRSSSKASERIWLTLDYFNCLKLKSCALRSAPAHVTLRRLVLLLQNREWRARVAGTEALFLELVGAASSPSDLPILLSSIETRVNLHAGRQTEHRALNI